MHPLLQIVQPILLYMHMLCIGKPSFTSHTIYPYINHILTNRSVSHVCSHTSTTTSSAHPAISLPTIHIFSHTICYKLTRNTLRRPNNTTTSITIDLIYDRINQLRIVKENLVYIIGLSPKLSDPKILMSRHHQIAWLHGIIRQYRQVRRTGDTV